MEANGRGNPAWQRLAPRQPGAGTGTLHFGSSLYVECRPSLPQIPPQPPIYLTLPNPLPSNSPRPTRRDSVDFVQQGAVIALALVLVEQPEQRAKPMREHINRLYGNKGAEVRPGVWEVGWGVVGVVVVWGVGGVGVEVKEQAGWRFPLHPAFRGPAWGRALCQPEGLGAQRASRPCVQPACWLRTALAHCRPAGVVPPSLAPGLQIMTRMGAIMAAGILDAGGRNATIGLRSRSGHFRRAAREGGGAR